MHRVSVLLSSLLLTALACTVGSGSEQASSSVSTESGSPGSCEDQLDQASCESFVASGEGCVWADLDHAVRTGDSCTAHSSGKSVHS